MTPGEMKTISFQLVRSTPKTRPIVYKTYVILRAPLRHPAIEGQQSAMNLIAPVSREQTEHITVSDIVFASSHTSLTLFLVISDWQS